MSLYEPSVYDIISKYQTRTDTQQQQKQQQEPEAEEEQEPQRQEPEEQQEEQEEEQQEQQEQEEQQEYSGLEENDMQRAATAAAAPPPKTTLIPEGVKQRVPDKDNDGVNDKYQALEQLLREKEELKTEQVTTQQAGTAQFLTQQQRNLQASFLSQDTNVRAQDEKLGSYNSVLAQQNQVSSEIEKAMAMNTLEKKSELWRIERSNNGLQALGTQFGLDVPSNRQY